MTNQQFLDQRGIALLWNKIIEKLATKGAVDSISSADSSIKIDGTNADPTIKVQLSNRNNNAICLDNKGLYVIPDIYSITKETLNDDSEFSAVYHLTKNGNNEGVSINIPKDMVVSSGEVKTVSNANIPYEGAAVGDKYIELILANANNDKLYIPANGLVEYLTSGSNANSMINISISNDHKITASIKEHSITNNELSTSINTSLGKADTAIQGLTASNHGIQITGNTTTLTIGIQLSNTSNNGLSIKNDGLYFEADISNLTDTTHIIPSDISDLTDNNNLIPHDIQNLTDTTNIIPHDLSDLTDTENLLDIYVPTDLSDLSDNNNIIPQDIDDLTDTTNIIPHDLSDLTDNNGLLDIPSDISDLTDNNGLIPQDVSDLSDNNSLISSLQDKIDLFNMCYNGKFTIFKNSILPKTYTPMVVGTNLLLFEIEDFYLPVSHYFDIMCVIKNNNTFQVIEHIYSMDNEGLSFTIDDISYRLILFVRQEYNDALVAMDVPVGKKLDANYFLLYDVTNDIPVITIPFQIDLYFLCNKNILGYEERKTEKIQHSIFYDFTQLRGILQEFNVDITNSFYLNGVAGWYKISNKPLLFEDRNSLLVFSADSVFVDFDMVKIMNNLLVHINNNGYDEIQITPDSINYLPYLISDENGFYFYLPTVVNYFNSMFNSSIGITYEINNPFLVSPTFIGTPCAPTATAGTSTTQIAPTAFVTNAVTAATSALLKREIVLTLPSSDIDTHTIYMIAKTTGLTNNSYNEFMYINNTWELIGDTGTTITIDSTITQNSNNAISSGAVYTAIGNIEAALAALL